MYYVVLPKTKIGPFKTYTQAKNWLKKNALKGNPPIEALTDPNFWTDHVSEIGTSGADATPVPPSEQQPSKKS